MSPITKGRKRSKKNITSSLSESEFYFLFGGMSYSGGCIDKVKIENMVMEYVKKNKV